MSPPVSRLETARILGVCLRAINDQIRGIETLGFHPVIQRGLLFSNVKAGLALVTGVTGSGKSTTLDAIIDANNHDFDGHIVIIAKDGREVVVHEKLPVVPYLVIFEVGEGHLVEPRNFIGD